MQEVQIVGGGIAGLVAAIEIAEGGRSVRLHEARARLGGRAETTPGPHRANLGAHALYRHGGFDAWLEERGLLPELVTPRTTAVRLVWRGRMRRLPLPLLPMFRDRGARAPIGEDYRSWARARIGASAAEAAIGFAALPTFHGDPGALSAAFVQERIARSLASGAVRYVVGGWQRLVDGLARHAEGLGVRIELRSRVSRLAEGPVVVATPLDAARRLLEDDSLVWPGARTAIFDVALRRRRRDPVALLDLDRRTYVSRYSSVDASLAPTGESLIQAVSGLREGEDPAAGQERIEAVMDLGLRGWRDRVTWQRRGFVDGGAGPADPPGTCWRDRPAIERGGDRWLIGDSVAAPGLLSEVAFESARRAAASLLEKTEAA